MNMDEGDSIDGDGAPMPSPSMSESRRRYRVGAAVLTAVLSGVVVLVLVSFGRDDAGKESLRFWRITPDAHDPKGRIGANALLSRLHGEVLAALDVRRLRKDLGLSPSADPLAPSADTATGRLRLAMSLFVSYLPAKRTDPVPTAVDLGKVTAMATGFSATRPYPKVMLMATTQPVGSIARKLRAAGYEPRRGILERKGALEGGVARYVAVGGSFVALAHERDDLLEALGRSQRSDLTEMLRKLDGTLRIGRRFPGFCVPLVAFSEEPAALRGTLLLGGGATTASRVVFGDRGPTKQPEGTDRISVKGIKQEKTGLEVRYDYAAADYRHTPAPLLLVDPPAGVLMYRCT